MCVILDTYFHFFAHPLTQKPLYKGVSALDDSYSKHFFSLNKQKSKNNKIAGTSLAKYASYTSL
jgi:hypothetical protein